MLGRLRSQPGDKHSLPIFRAGTAATAGTGHLRSGPGTGFQLDRHLYRRQRRLCFRQQQLDRPMFGTDRQLQHRRLPLGGTIGGNYQWGQFVLGIEGDGDW